MFYLFKVRYSFNFISNKFFIFLSFLHLPFFLAKEKFIVEKNKLERLNQEIDVAIREFGKMQSILRRFKKGRVFKKDDKEIKELAQLISSLKKACFKKEELESLKRLESQLDYELRSSFNKIRKLNLDSNKNKRNSLWQLNDNDNDAMSRFILEVLNERDRLNKQIVCKKIYYEGLRELGYDVASFVSYYLNIDNNNNWTKYDHFKFFEKNQLLGVLKNEDVTWNYLCKKDAENKKNLYGLERFSKLLSTIYPKKKGEDSFMRILNKKYFIECSNAKGLIDDKVGETEIKRLLKIYNLVLNVVPEPKCNTIINPSKSSTVSRFDFGFSYDSKGQKNRKNDDDNITIYNCRLSLEAIKSSREIIVANNNGTSFFWVLKRNFTEVKGKSKKSKAKNKKPKYEKVLIEFDSDSNKVISEYNFSDIFTTYFMKKTRLDLYKTGGLFRRLKESMQLKYDKINSDENKNQNLFSGLDENKSDISVAKQSGDIFCEKCLSIQNKNSSSNKSKVKKENLFIEELKHLEGSYSFELDDVIQETNFCRLKKSIYEVINNGEANKSLSDFLVHDKYIVDADSKIYGFIISTSKKTEEAFLKKCEEEYIKKNLVKVKGKREQQRQNEIVEKEWNNIKNEALKYHEYKILHIFNEKKIEKVEEYITLLQKVKNSLYVLQENIKRLYIGLKKIDESINSSSKIRKEIKNQQISVFNEIENGLYGNNEEIYDKEPLLEDVADLLDKIKNRLSEQFTSLGGNSKYVNSPTINILPENRANNGNLNSINNNNNNNNNNNIFFQIKRNNPTVAYLYRTPKTILRIFLRGIIFPLCLFRINILCSAIYSSCNSIFSSKGSLIKIVCNALACYVFIFFVFITVYDFYLIFAKESRKKKRYKKGKKINHSYIISKFLRKIYLRIAGTEGRKIRIRIRIRKKRKIKRRRKINKIKN